MENNNYQIRRKAQIKQLLRLRLGFLQFIHRPVLNLLWLFVGVFIAIIVILKNKIVEVIAIPQIIEPIFNIALNVFIVIMPILLIVALLENIAECTAKRDENALMVAFSSKALRNGCPILISKKRIKNSDVITREYYSNISLDVWNEHKNAIADALNAHFIEEIQYGGKGNNNGKIIVIKTAKGRKPIDRGVLYDDEL
ncbi:MAG: hypothetical protein NC213_04080 [Acetobacter sp.]|nr:hypothetical protein [Bacteroides sp.]MCM1340902.1 hypothetical protein [Acetobacter sp.]MCM1432542.1 hypothetical protein [Clostridiales bacterium]